MTEGTHYAIVINRGCDVVGLLLQCFYGVTHRNAYARL